MIKMQDERWSEIVDIVYEVVQETEAREATPLMLVQKSLDEIGIELNESDTKDVIYIVSKVSEFTNEINKNGAI